MSSLKNTDFNAKNIVAYMLLYSYSTKKFILIVNWEKVFIFTFI